MKKGDIIRRQTKSGFPVGQYMRILSMNGNKIKVVGTSGLSFTVFKTDNLKVYSKTVLQISKEDYIKLKVAFIECYRHELTKSFDKVYGNPPDIIEFWTKGIDERLFFTLDFAEKTRKLLTLYVKLYLDYRIPFYGRASEAI